jgi:hypothetical protein
MPPLAQARALLSSPPAAECGALTGKSWRVSVVSQWSILLTFANRKRPRCGGRAEAARIQAGATSDVMGTSSAYTKPVGS